jgi:hypothetical protein
MVLTDGFLSTAQKYLQKKLIGMQLTLKEYVQTNALGKYSLILPDCVTFTDS